MSLNRKEPTDEYLKRVHQEVAAKTVAAVHEEWLHNVACCLSTFPLLYSYAKWMHPEGPLLWAVATLSLLHYSGYMSPFGKVLIDTAKIGVSNLGMFTHRTQGDSEIKPEILMRENINSV